jgi:hypothetical protein
MESDRMGFLTARLDEKVLQEQKDVVRNEILENEGAPTDGIESPENPEMPGRAIWEPLAARLPFPGKALWLSRSELWSSSLAMVALTYRMRFARVCMSTESFCADWPEAPAWEPGLALSRLARVLALMNAPLLPTPKLCRRALSDCEAPLSWLADSPFNWTSVEAAPL